MQSLKPIAYTILMATLLLGGCKKKEAPQSEDTPGDAPKAESMRASMGSMGTMGAMGTDMGAVKNVAPSSGKNPRVVMRTTMGPILIELYADKAPITVKNFLRYVDEKFFDNTIFHRVMSNFMIQGGGFTEDLSRKQTHGPIKNEADNGLNNERGTIAMARTNVVDSATAQFFINVKNNAMLNHRGPGRAFGYAVFGKVIQGMNVVDKIKNTPVEARGRMFQHLPTTAVVIKSVRRAKN